ncbi:imidazole glycerol phosphate synthase subunit HisH [Devosia salina]|uniref:Imidazole glycerol phosphate synthase subunit HisH n=2 Tax=Devosia salina TaxID=2860336 RepID=A0ABX8WL87_9HYPH|nr:imidazole glycerol phosphate synthase subunit HisH [Devosia salina]
MNEVGIIKMPIGNLQSVLNAVYENGLDPVLLDPTSDMDSLTHLIMPGVGHFMAVKAQLDADGWPDKVRAFAASGRPTLGICVGMQLLATTGTEGRESPGLDLIPARVQRLAEGNEMLRVPHVGWNSVEFTRPHPVLSGVRPGADYYFVHSYAMQTECSEHSLGETVYGQRFTSIVGRDNVIGFQFHPEKSQINGLKLLDNFCNWDGKC